MKISYSIAAHAAVVGLALAFVSAPKVIQQIPHYAAHVVIEAPTTLYPAVVPVVRFAKLATPAVPTQGSPARVNLGHEALSSKLVLAATTAAPEFGELPEQGQLTLPAARQATVKAAPVAKLVGFEQRPVAQHFAVQPAVTAKAVPVVEPTVTHMEHPEYTKDALRAQVQGTVSVRVILKADGTVQILGTTQSLGYGLEASAVRTAETIKFRPATYEGTAVDFPTTIHISFQLSSQEGL